MFNYATKKNEISEKLKDKNMAMETLTISRFLEGIQGHDIAINLKFELLDIQPPTLVNLQMLSRMI